jgi:chromosome segregation ATPase
MICEGTPITSNAQFQDLLGELKTRSGRLGLPDEQPEDFERCRTICHQLRNECQVGELRLAMVAMKRTAEKRSSGGAALNGPLTTFER